MQTQLTLKSKTYMWRSCFHYANRYEDDCPTVAILNIYYFLMNKYNRSFQKYDIDSEKYKSLYKITHTDNGEFRKLLKHLDLKVVKEFNSLWDLSNEKLHNSGNMLMSKSKRIELPLLVHVWHKNYGNHVVSIIDYEPITQSFRIPNFGFRTNTQGWVYDEDISVHLRSNKKIMLIGLKH